MSESEIIKTKLLSQDANVDELRYRNEIQLKDSQFSSMEKWYRRIKDGRLSYPPFLIEKWRIRGKIIELGAGCCWLSSELSKEPSVKHVYALDFSETLLEKIAPPIMDFLCARKDKITRIVGDFNIMDFEDKTFDFIIFDAALHHATNINRVLKEGSRILKDNGRIIAIREPVLPALMKWKRKSFGQEEKRYGIQETIYLKSEWKEIFAKAGLELSFISFSPRIVFKCPVVLLFNGYLFSSFIFAAKKKGSKLIEFKA